MWLRACIFPMSPAVALQVNHPARDPNLLQQTGKPDQL
ncbi:hypothetical protein X011_19015 [Mycobacterium tuberculosis variant microti OV254]|nr:hypothetical protein X011_19015 [Mycobacterium tuberculosis variant microti OV254]